MADQKNSFCFSPCYLINERSWQAASRRNSRFATAASWIYPALPLIPAFSLLIRFAEGFPRRIMRCRFFYGQKGISYSSDAILVKTKGNPPERAGTQPLGE